MILVCCGSVKWCIVEQGEPLRIIVLEINFNGAIKAKNRNNSQKY